MRPARTILIMQLSNSRGDDRPDTGRHFPGAGLRLPRFRLRQSHRLDHGRRVPDPRLLLCIQKTIPTNGDRFRKLGGFG